MSKFLNGIFCLLIASCLFLPCLIISSSGAAIDTNKDTTYTTQEDLIDPSEWFDVDTKPIHNEVITVTKPIISTGPIIETQETITTLPKPSKEVHWYSTYRVYPTFEPTTHAGGAEIDIDFFAKLLYCEAGSMSWEAQVYTASAILNFCDRYNVSMWDAGHNIKQFAVAPYVDEAIPREEQYEVIEYVMSGWRIAEICHFRMNRYHTFGMPICEVDGHYFSVA